MRKFSLLIFALTLFNGNLFCQEVRTSSFIFDNLKMTYSFSSTAKNFISDFYIIVSESETKEITFFEDLKSCYENNADFYLLNYDPNISLENKQKLLFEFVKAVTAKRKLIDSKLHLVANVNLDDYYNNFREKDEFYLNSINSIQIFTDPIYSPCQFTSKR